MPLRLPDHIWIALLVMRKPFPVTPDHQSRPFRIIFALTWDPPGTWNQQPLPTRDVPANELLSLWEGSPNELALDLNGEGAGINLRSVGSG